MGTDICESFMCKLLYRKLLYYDIVNCCIHGAAYYWLFSKSGYTFTNTNPDIELITLENMYKI